jgi:hypothetical protein
MSRRYLVAMLCPAALGGLIPIQAEASQSTSCIGRAEVMLISPGWSSTPTAGTVETQARGIEECHGPMDGHQPTGPVRTHHSILYGWRDPDTCSTLEFKGHADHHIPTATGVVIIRNHFTGNLDPVKEGVMTASFQGTKFSGRFGAQPLEGDCITAPLTRMEVFWQGTWHGTGR